MALIAEEVVEEWLNQQGFFTIRGIKVGNEEMDILAAKFEGGKLDLRHYEVQASVRPVTYVSKVTKEVQKSKNRAKTSAKGRSNQELDQTVKEWVEGKFRHPDKIKRRNQLAKGKWSYHFVIYNLRDAEELSKIKKSRIKVVTLKEILRDFEALNKEMKKRKDIRKEGIFTAAGRDLMDLMLVGRE